ncbi:hypothetical protein BKA60DRAFT_577239 [Fusarium oxysporum]|nr:hypothetical protein BKA60DRAFT_577239 [Fusarium oxysporum]
MSRRLTLLLCRGILLFAMIRLVRETREKRESQRERDEREQGFVVRNPCSWLHRSRSQAVRASRRPTQPSGRTRRLAADHLLKRGLQGCCTVGM